MKKEEKTENIGTKRQLICKLRKFLISVEPILMDWRHNEEIKFIMQYFGIDALV